MGNRKRVSNELRRELDTIPNIPANLALRYKYWKLITAAQKSETAYRKASVQIYKNKKKETKNGGTMNPGLALLKEKQGGQS